MSLSKNPFVEFLKATLAGGVLFLLPVVLVLIVLHRAMSYARRGETDFAFIACREGHWGLRRKCSRHIHVDPRLVARRSRRSH